MPTVQRKTGRAMPPPEWGQVYHGIRHAEVPCEARTPVGPRWLAMTTGANWTAPSAGSVVTPTSSAPSAGSTSVPALARRRAPFRPVGGTTPIPKTLPPLGTRTQCGDVMSEAENDAPKGKRVYLLVQDIYGVRPHYVPRVIPPEECPCGRGPGHTRLKATGCTPP